MVVLFEAAGVQNENNGTAQSVHLGNLRMIGVQQVLVGGPEQSKTTVVAHQG